jgi:hypothetical protein
MWSVATTEAYRASDSTRLIRSSFGMCLGLVTLPGSLVIAASKTLPGSGYKARVFGHRSFKDLAGIRLQGPAMTFHGVVCPHRSGPRGIPLGGRSSQMT